MNNTIQSDSFIIRLLIFTKKSYDPFLHIIFAGAWFLAIEGGILLFSDQRALWHFNLPMIIGIFTLFFTSFFIRVVDEIKDLDYDRVHNPDRPLVIGTVTINDLYWYMIFICIIVVILNLFLDPLLVIIAVIDMLYALLLLKAEKMLPIIANNMFINLLVTHPVNLLMSIYILNFVILQYSFTLNMQSIALIISYVLAFLHFEFTRKTTWPEFAKPGEKLYSNSIGSRNAALLSLLFAVSSCIIVLFLFNPLQRSGISFFSSLLPIIPLIPAVINTIAFFRKREKRYHMQPKGMLFHALYHQSIIIHALIYNKIQFF